MNTAARFGNYCAFISIGFILILHFIGVGSFGVKLSSYLFSTLCEIVFIVLAIYYTRKNEYNGYIEFRVAARAGLTTVLINAIVLTLFQYLYYQFIDIHYVDNFIESFQHWIALAGKGDDKLMIDRLNDYKSSFTSISAAWSSFSTTLFFESIFTLIIAKIFQRNPPSEHTIEP